MQVTQIMLVVVSACLELINLMLYAVPCDKCLLEFDT